MQIGIVGLGRMGGNITRRLLKKGHRCVVFDRNAAATTALGERRRVAGQRSEGPRAPARQAARGLGDAARGRGDRGHGERARQGDGGGRHHHRWRQQLLQGRHKPRTDARRAAHPLRRCGDERRHLGAARGLLHDDRRREGDRRDISIRSSMRWRRGQAILRRRPVARAAIRAPSAAMCIAGRWAPATSRR